MNNIVSDAVIERLNNADTRTARTLFDQVMNDTDYQKRRLEQIGVNNRLFLVPATTHVLGRSADGVPIYARPNPRDDNAVNLRCHKDYPNIIATNKSGYLSGFTVTTEDQQLQDKLDMFLKLNTFKATFNNLVKSVTSYGAKAVRLYVDQITGIESYTTFEPWEYIPFYSKSDRLVAVMTWERTSKTVESTTQQEYYVSFLTDKQDLYFTASKSDMMLDTVNYPAMMVGDTEIQAGARPHTFKGVPFVEFFNNTIKTGDVEKTLDMQDTRDELITKANIGFDTFADNILVDKTQDDGAVITTEDYEKMKVMLKNDGLLVGDFTWLSNKYEGYPALEKHLQLLESDIYQGSNTYSPESIGGTSIGTSPTAFQIKQKMKLLSDSTVETETQFEKSLLELFRLVTTRGIANNSEAWKTINISYQHTMPEDKLVSLKQIAEIGVGVPPKVAFETGNFNWGEIEPLMQEQESKEMRDFLGNNPIPQPNID